MKLWKGIEEEGKYKGKKTVFVADPRMHTDTILYHLEKDKDIKQVYFGAGMCTEINISLIQKVIKENPYLFYTVEIDVDKLNEYYVPELKKLNINVIITINNKNFSLLNYLNKETTQIKLQNLKGTDKHILTVGELKTFKETDLSKLKGKKYIDDEVIIE